MSKTYSRYFKPIPDLLAAHALLEEALRCVQLPAEVEAETPDSLANRINEYLLNSKTHIDVYRVIKMFSVLGPGEQHALKKILCAGERGFKDYRQDLLEARDSLQREIDMLDEDEAANRAEEGKDTF